MEQQHNSWIEFLLWIKENPEELTNLEIQEVREKFSNLIVLNGPTIEIQEAYDFLKSHNFPQEIIDKDFFEAYEIFKKIYPEVPLREIKKIGGFPINTPV